MKDGVKEPEVSVLWQLSLWMLRDAIELAFQVRE